MQGQRQSAKAPGQCEQLLARATAWREVSQHLLGIGVLKVLDAVNAGMTPPGVAVGIPAGDHY